MSRRNHHGHRPVARPIELRVLVEQVKGRGAQCRLVSDREGTLFWLPIAHPAEWPAAPEPGEIVSVKLPRWLAEKHRPVVALRAGFQSVLSFTPPPPLGAEAYREGSFPVTDQSNDLRGALFKNDRKEKDTHPDYKGDVTIDGRKFWLSGWIKEGKKGKYMSLAAKPADEQRQPPAPANSYAQATGRDDRQQEQQRGGRMPVEEEIPFGPEWR